MANKDRDRFDRPRRRSDEWEESATSTVPAMPVNFDGSINLVNLGGGMGLGSDGHIHLAGMDLMGN